jgi:hypothetical protein
MLLGKDNKVRSVDLGLVTSSQADSMVQLILNNLMQADEVQKNIIPGFLVRNWPPAFKEWSTKSVRDAFFASPLFPRLLTAEAVKETIARGVTNGTIAYVGKSSAGDYKPFVCGTNLTPNEVEISDDVYIITKEVAQSYLDAKKKPVDEKPVVSPVPKIEDGSGQTATPQPSLFPNPPTKSVKSLLWSGDVPHQKWTVFYMKFLSKFVSDATVKLTVSVELTPKDGVPAHKIEEAKAALREMGLSDHFDMK